MKYVAASAFLVFTLSAATAFDGSRWWSYVQFLASDDLQGRDTGSEGHKKAVQYVAAQFERDGLKPAGEQGYVQPVKFISKELDESKRFLIGSIPRALETNAAIAAFLQAAEFFDLGLDYDLKLPDLLSAVTLDDVNAAARRALDPDRATVVIAGPYVET